MAIIFENFIKPLMALRPKNMNFYDWLDELFCVNDRFITRCVAKKEFRMPGFYCAAPNRLVPGFANRVVKAGSEVWTRVDRTMPDRIDVEVGNGRHGETQIFALKRAEFQRILPMLEEFPFPERKKKRHSWEKEKF